MKVIEILFPLAGCCVVFAFVLMILRGVDIIDDEVIGWFKAKLLGIRKASSSDVSKANNAEFEALKAENEKLKSCLLEAKKLEALLAKNEELDAWYEKKRAEFDEAYRMTAELVDFQARKDKQRHSEDCVGDEKLLPTEKERSIAASYRIFGLTEVTLSETSLKERYRELAKRYHPDNSREPNAEFKFQKLQRAHDILELELLKKKVKGAA